MRLPLVLTLAALLAPPAVVAVEEPRPVPASPEGAPEKDRAWNLSIGTGAGGFVEFVDAFAGSGPGSYDTTRRENRLQVNARVDHELGRWIRAGVAWTYNRWTEAYFSGGTRVGEIDNSVHAVMLDGTIRWYRTDRVEFYSALAAGAGRWKQAGTGIGTSKDGVSSGFAFQLRYAGISLGNERIRAFVDLGIGFEGMIVGGITLRL